MPPSSESPVSESDGAIASTNLAADAAASIASTEIVADSSSAVAATARRQELSFVNRPRPRAFGKGRYGVGKHDDRDDTRYSWARVMPPIAALLLCLGLAQPARAVNAYCEAADATTSVYGFCQPDVDAEGVNAWGDKNNTNFQMVEDALSGVGSSTAAVAALITAETAARVAADFSVGAATKTFGVWQGTASVRLAAFDVWMGTASPAIAGKVDRAGDTMTGLLTAPDYTATYGLTAATASFSSDISIGGAPPVTGYGLASYKSIILYSTANELRFAGAQDALIGHTGNFRTTFQTNGVVRQIIDLGGGVYMPYGLTASSVTSQGLSQSGLPTTGGGQFKGYSAFGSGILAAYASQNGNKLYASLYNDADGDGILDLNNLNEVLQVHISPNGDSYFNGGNVGVNTTSPGAKLDVNGKARVLDDGSAGLGLLIGPDGNEGSIRYNTNGNFDITPRSSYNTNFTAGNVLMNGNLYLYEASADASRTLFFGKSDGTSGWTIGSGVTANDGVYRIYSNDTGVAPIAIDDAAGNAITMAATGGLSVTGAFQVGGSSGSRVDTHGHTYFRGTTPTVTSCGTSPSITGTDAAGKVTTGSPGSTTCTINFASAWDSAPHCVPTSNAAAGVSGQAVGVQSVSTTQLVLAFEVTFGSVDVRWVCFGTE